MKVEIKNFKPAENLSEETLAFTGTLYIDGKKAAHLSNRGHGDPIQIDWIDHKSGLETSFQGYLATLLPWDCDGKAMAMDEEVFIGDLCDALMKQREIKKWTKAKLIFRLVGDPEGEYRTFGPTRDLAARERGRKVLREKYGNKIAELHG